MKFILKLAQELKKKYLMSIANVYVQKFNVKKESMGVEGRELHHFQANLKKEDVVVVVDIVETVVVGKAVD